jgi:protein gp37
MGAITQIAWCDATFNPWVGCLRVSTGCDRCYAAALSWRYGWRDGKGRDLWDVSADRKRTSSAYWARAAPLERMRASRRHAASCLLCEHGRCL